MMRVSKLMGWFIDDDTYALGQDIVKNYKDWKQGDYTFYNDNLQLWTSNVPLFNLDSYPNTSMFNIVERIYIMRCIKRSKIMSAIK